MENTLLYPLYVRPYFLLDDGNQCQIVNAKVRVDELLCRKGNKGLEEPNCEDAG